MEEIEEQYLDPSDPMEAAEAAGLYYVMNGESGFTRQKQEDVFIYLDSAGRQVTSPKQLERFKALVIPPAWTEVWICRRPNGHIQVTGRDAKGRKQYRYHPDWSQIRSRTKFNRIVQFGEALPAIRAQVDEDLRRQGLPHEKVTALVIRLLEQTLIRVGNQEYALQNNSYGLTTLLDDHVTIEGSRVMMEFTGKRGKAFEVDLQSRRLARLVKRCQELPGQRLFQYLDENGQCCQSLTSGDVNEYLRGVTGQDFSAKDFRTWGGTVTAAVELYQLGMPADEKAAEKHIVQVVKRVAETLGNTPTICRNYYIHPGILDAYRDGSLFKSMAEALQQTEVSDDNGLTHIERATLSIFRNQID